MNKMELKANLGLVFRGEYSALSEFSERLEELVNEMGIQIVHKHVSASKLWIREGDEMNDQRN
jgi:hypothetical protein